MNDLGFLRWLLAPAIALSALAATWGQAQVNPAEVEKIKAALPAEAPAKAAKPRKLLVFSRTRGFRHSSIAVGHEAIRQMGEKTGAYAATGTEDPGFFEQDKLKQFDAVLMLNTTMDCFSTDPKEWDKNPAKEQLKVADDARAERLKKSFADFVENGGGLAGIHSATDTLYDMPKYGEMIGGYFDGHPWGSGDTVTVKVRDGDHPLTKPFKAVGDRFDIKDEIYQLKNWDASKQHVLLGLYLGEGTKTDMKKGGIKRTDGDFAVSWIKRQGKGRVFYCSLGHNEHIYWTPEVLRHYLGGLQFALGDYDVPVKPGSTKP
ncbi:MAG: ThuA domain-containing protein [Verrucomicrobiales bacterium]